MVRIWSTQIWLNDFKSMEHKGHLNIWILPRALIEFEKPRADQKKSRSDRVLKVKVCLKASGPRGAFSRTYNRALAKAEGQSSIRECVSWNIYAPQREAVNILFVPPSHTRVLRSTRCSESWFEWHGFINRLDSDSLFDRELKEDLRWHEFVV